MTIQELVRRRAVQVLLVEDDPSDVLLTKEALRRSKISNHIHVVEDGLQALEFLRREAGFEDSPRPDLILLDLNMPRMDGQTTLAAIKSDPELVSIPVVVLTTSDDQHDIRNAYSKHAAAYVTKPVDLEGFRRVVERIHEFWFQIVKLPRKR